MQLCSVGHGCNALVPAATGPYQGPDLQFWGWRVYRLCVPLGPCGGRWVLYSLSPFRDICEWLCRLRSLRGEEVQNLDKMTGSHLGVGGVGMAPYFPKYGCNIKPTVKCGIGLETTPFLSKRTNFYSSLSQPFCPRETLEIIFRAWGTPAKPIQWRSVDNMPLVLVVRTHSFQWWSKYHPCRQLIRLLVSCCWLCQMELALELCRHHQIAGQPPTAQGAPSTLWRKHG